jgi:hypothetical protein
VKRQNIGEQIDAQFGKDADLREALAKLREIEAKRAAVSAELDQVSAELHTDPAVLARRVLDGDELTDRDQLFARRQALQSRLEAFTLAATMQQREVSDARARAAASVSTAVAPSVREAQQRFIDSLAALRAAYDELAQVGLLTSRHGLSGWALPNLRSVSGALAAIDAAVDNMTDKTVAHASIAGAGAEVSIPPKVKCTAG